MDKATLIQRAELVLSDLNSGGLLAVAQSDRFIQTLQEQPTILNVARVVPMNTPSMEINKIQFGSDILKPASQVDQATGTSPYDGRYLAQSDWSKPTTSKVTLNTKEVMAEIHLPYEVVEDNIERENFQDTLLALIAKRAALDIEKVIIQGDTGGTPGTLLDMFDGILVQTTSHVVDAGGDTLDPQVLSDIVKALPQQFREAAGLTYYTTSNAEIDMRTAIASRNTGLGDAMLTGKSPVMVHGYPLKGVHKMPSGKGFFTDPKNIVVGFQRNVRIEVDRDIRAREMVFVLTCRFDIKLEEETAVVKLVNAAA